MTYCLALRLDDGLVFLSDTRTNAGVDNISTYRKLHVIDAGNDRIFTIQSAGNLATTQEVLDRIDRDLARPGGSPGDHTTLSTVEHLFEAALYLGQISRDVVASHRDALSASGADGTATFILGGQIRGARPEIFLVYPEGNYIRASNTRPFLQIGEAKYGKFWLDLMLLHPDPDLAIGTKLALASMLGTARANLSVGPPYDLGVYRNDSLTLEQHRIEAESAYLGELQHVFVDHMMQAFGELPPIPWAD